MRGTQRTPHERGYNPSDQRHNLAVAGSVDLPWSVQVSGILKLVSGSPTKVQAGIDPDSWAPTTTPRTVTDAPASTPPVWS
jgi:hypothetical protein